MAKSDKNVKTNGIFDYYETAVKNAQEVLKAFHDKGEYVDVNNGNPIVKPTKGVFAVIHMINRVSFIPTTDDNEFFLNGAHIGKDGKAVYESNCHGGMMKKLPNSFKMIENFNSEMKCEGLKIKAIICVDSVIPIPLYVYKESA